MSDPKRFMTRVVAEVPDRCIPATMMHSLKRELDDGFDFKAKFVSVIDDNRTGVCHGRPSVS
jgi:nitrate/TMAO reductase-like tetraheme cytochrome c subunit